MSGPPPRSAAARPCPLPQQRASLLWTREGATDVNRFNFFLELLGGDVASFGLDARPPDDGRDVSIFGDGDASFALGVWTLVAYVPVTLALLHQAGAILVFAAALYHLHGVLAARRLATG